MRMQSSVSDSDSDSNSNSDEMAQMELVQVSEFSSDFSSSEDNKAVNAVLHRHLVKFIFLSDSDGSDAGAVVRFAPIGSLYQYC